METDIKLKSGLIGKTIEKIEFPYINEDEFIRIFFTDGTILDIFNVSNQYDSWLEWTFTSK